MSRKIDAHKAMYRNCSEKNRTDTIVLNLAISPKLRVAKFYLIFVAVL